MTGKNKQKKKERDEDEMNQWIGFVILHNIYRII